MDLSVLIPWRPDGGQRDDVFRYLLPKWRETGAQICIGTDSGSGPFNCAEAQNNAFFQAKHDNLVMFGADMFPDLGVMNYAAQAGATGARWVPLFESTAYYSKLSTDQILTGDPLASDDPFEVSYPYCEGVLGLNRAAYIEAGGMDERFRGWGAEDSAFRHTLKCLYGDREPLPATLWCLWHAGEHRVLGPENRALVDSYNAISNEAEMRDFLLARGTFLQ